MVSLLKKNTSKVGLTRDDMIFNGVNLLLMTLIFIAVSYPLVYVISSSFSNAEAVISGQVRLLPVRPTLEGYKAVFKYDDVWVGYGNSIYYTVVGTLINVAMTVLISYPLSRKDFVGRNGIMFLLTFTMFFSGGLIPTYLLVKNLGLINTRWAMMIPNAMGVWNVIITRTFFQSNIPTELYDSARVDGCSNTRMLINIVLPLSGPIIAVITLFYAVGHWNAFFNALLFLKDKELRPLQMVLREILIENSPRGMDQIMSSEELEAMNYRQFLQALLQYSLIVVASIPVLIVYPFVQKYFVQGVMVGAIKG